MDRSAAVLITALAGGLVAMQAPVNGRLGKAIGTLPAATVSFGLGLALLAAIVVLSGKAGDIGEARHVPWWYLIGGVLGVAYVSTVLVTVGTLGAGGVTAATVAGQLSLALVLDQFGWLGVRESPITAAKVLGVALLAAGVALIVRD